MPRLKMPRSRSLPTFETLESRCLMSATPSSTIHDGGGTQLLTNVQSGQTYQHYLIRSTLILYNVSNVTIENCDIGGFNENGILIAGVTNVSIVNNNFHDIGRSTGIYGPDDTVNNCHFDNNTFNNVFEGIHVGFGNSGGHDDTFDNNYIDDYQRIAIELQSVSTGGLKVMNNYCVAMPGTTEGGMALSIATGDSTTIPGAKTAGNEIAYNVCIGAVGTQGSGAIENYGSAANIHDNYIKGPWLWSIIWNWTGLNGNVPWYVTNNTLIGSGAVAAPEGFGSKDQNIQPTLSGNQSFALNAANAPATPTVAQIIGGTNTTTTTVSANPPGTATFTAMAETDGVHLTLPTGGGTLTWTAADSSGQPLAALTSDEKHSTAIPAGTTTFVDTSVPNNWRVLYTFTGATGQNALVITKTTQVFSPTVQAQQDPLPVATPAASTPVVAPPVVTAPVVTAPVVAPVASIPSTIAAPILVGYIPVNWQGAPSQAVPNYDGPLP